MPNPDDPEDVRDTYDLEDVRRTGDDATKVPVGGMPTGKAADGGDPLDGMNTGDGAAKASVGGMPTGEAAAEAGPAASSDWHWTTPPLVEEGAADLGRIDRYRLLGKCGRGGFGAVYHARDTVADVDVALKALPPEVSHVSGEFERVRKNFVLVKKLKHRHIASLDYLHEVQDADDAGRKLLGVDPKDFLVVMEYVPGASLAERPQATMPVGQALGVCAQVAEALDYAHSEKIIHRDIKPGNIQIDPKGRVKVLDFGLAAEIRHSLSRLTKKATGTSGIRPYMAPEQWRGVVQGAAADQYALGVLFHELVSGQVPFHGVFGSQDEAVMRLAVLDEAPGALPELDRKQNEALLRALSKEPGERFAYCTDFVGALRGKVVPPSRALPLSAPGAAEANACPNPSCGAGNPEDVKYCESCGAGMTRLCPECERENSIHRPFCGGCGCSVTGFLQARDTLQRMQSYAAEKRWRRVRKELRELPQSLQLSGEKGKALLAEIGLLDQQANERTVRCEELLAKLQELTAAEQLEQALEVVYAYREVDPHSDEVNVLPEDLHARIEARDFAQMVERTSQFEEHEEFEQAIGEYAKFLAQHSAGRHAGAARVKVEEELPARIEERDFARTVERASQFEDREEFEQAIEEYGNYLTQHPEGAHAGAARAMSDSELPRLAAYRDSQRQAEGFRDRVTAAEAMLREKRLTSCGQRVDGLQPVQAAYALPEDAGWREMWEETTARLSALGDSLAQRKAKLAVLRQDAAAALGAQEYGQCVQLAGQAAELTVEKTECEDDLAKAKDALARIERLQAKADAGVRSRRWPKADAACAAILALQSHNQAAAAMRDQIAANLRQHRRRKRRLMAVATVVALLAAAGAVYGLRRSERTQHIAASGPVRLPPSVVPVAKARLAPLDGLAAGSREAQERQQEFAKKLGLPLEVRAAKSGILFRLVPPGTFTMGSRADEQDRKDDETLHFVALSQAFYLGKYEVTQGQWETVMGSYPHSIKGSGPAVPVDVVSWVDCQEFVKRLCVLEGVPAGTYRLPTESEWEYACRAGTPTAFAYGDSLSSHQANFDGNYPYGGAARGPYVTKPVAVGSYKPNAWGLYDMHGNVWECCQDWSGDYPMGPRTDPVGPADGSSRVIRGGYWLNSAEYCRAASRQSNPPFALVAGQGFRIALVPPVQR